jgi:hypothetical protein
MVFSGCFGTTNNDHDKSSSSSFNALVIRLMALLEKRQKDAQAIGGTNKKGGRSQRGAKDGAKIGPKRCLKTPKITQ